MFAGQGRILRDERCIIGADILTADRSSHAIDEDRYIIICISFAGYLSAR